MANFSAPFEPIIGVVLMPRAKKFFFFPCDLLQKKNPTNTHNDTKITAPITPPMIGPFLIPEDVVPAALDAVVAVGPASAGETWECG